MKILHDMIGRSKFCLQVQTKQQEPFFDFPQDSMSELHWIGTVDGSEIPFSTNWDTKKKTRK